MYCSESYPLEAFEYWMDAKNNSWVIGDFVWTAFDYVDCGDIDICGWKRPQSYYRDVLWQDTPQLSIFVSPPKPTFPPNPEREYWSIWHWHDVVADWNWKGYENKSMPVHVYSSYESVELFRNGKSLGKKPTNESNKFTATWNVSYQPGELKAIGYSGRKKGETILLQSAGTPSRIQLTADTTTLAADGQSLSYVTVEVLDEKGVVNPKAENLLSFSLTGPGEIIAVANSNPMSTESFQGKERKAWQGKCLVIIKSNRQEGEVRLKATGEGLSGGEVKINVINR
jgi:beta-galactosidase